MTRTKKTTVVTENVKENKTMENKEEKKFNYIEYLKYQILKAYFTKKFKGEDTEQIVIRIKYSNSNANAWFYKTGALKFGEQRTVYDEDGNQTTELTIKELNLDAKAISKAGKEFKVFNNYDIAKATKGALKVA